MTESNASEIRDEPGQPEQTPVRRACDHFRQARIEVLKGIRELLDHRIEQLSRGPQKGTRVTVE